MTVMNGLQCGSDISALWGDQYDAKCIYVFPFEIGFAISNFLLDLSIILLPLPKVNPKVLESPKFSTEFISDLVLAHKR